MAAAAAAAAVDFLIVLATAPVLGFLLNRLLLDPDCSTTTVHARIVFQHNIVYTYIFIQRGCVIKVFRIGGYYKTSRDKIEDLLRNS